MGNQTQEFEDNAVLAKAAYAELHPGMTDEEIINALMAPDPITHEPLFTREEANNFIAHYDILDSLSDPDSGAYAVMFQGKSSFQVTLSIRGTEVTDIGDITADAELAILGLTSNGQYTAIKNFYDNAVSTGVISASEDINITGHSLGGYLATCFTLLNQNVVNQAYTYNSPGIFGAVFQAMTALGLLPDSLPFDKITNVYSSDQPSLLQGWGIRVGNTVELPGRFHSLQSLIDALSAPGVNYKADDALHWWTIDFIRSLMNTMRNRFNNSSHVASPIILDLDKDGVETTAVGNWTYFDHDGNGFAENTGWVSPDDGLLVMDRDGNGTIDTGKELFGSETLLNNGQKAANGFQALEELDANNDGKVDASDTQFSQLRVWKDIDGDGYSATDELFTLSEVGIRAIDISYTNSTTIDANANEHRQHGSFAWSDGTCSAADDVWFKSDKMDTVAATWLNVPDDIAALPDLQGYGNVYDLHQAMVRDTSGTLTSLVQQFVAAEEVSTRNSLMSQILYKWTGSDAAVAGSYGDYIDARKVATMEKLFGQDYVGNWGPKIAGPNSASLLSQSYDGLYEMYYGQLMSQSHLKSLYDLITFQWDDATGTLSGDLSAVATEVNARLNIDYNAELIELSEFVRSLRGLEAANSTNYAEFKEAVAVDPSLFTFIVSGTSGNDALNGTEGDEIFYGNAGNDSIYGGNGGWDTFDGGTGNDSMVGGADCDTYFVLGNDVIFDSGGTDTVKFAPGITADSLEFGLSGIMYDNGIVITNKNTGERLRLQNWFAGAEFKIEHFKFDNDTELTAQDINDRAIAVGLVVAGASGETVWGPDYLGAHIYGNNGNDILYAGLYADTIDGGAGNDQICSGYGSDTILWGRGSGQDMILDYGGTQDRIVLGSDILPSDIQLARSGDNMTLSIVGSTDSLTINNWGLCEEMIEQIEFADGTIWDEACIKQRLLVSTDGNDAINGFSSNDSIKGGMGADTLTGGSGDDTLDGGAGIDSLSGDMGDDTYIVDAGDSVYENYNAGNDTVRSYINFTLSANVENLTLMGTNALLGTGNVLDNVMTGNGAGSTLAAGLGNDTYVISSTNDVIMENAGEGTDIVKSTIAYTLGNNLEYLYLIGADAIGATGNGSDNYMFGGLGNNTINGAAGNDIVLGGAGDDQVNGDAGNDYLYGGSGNDTVNGGDGNDQLFGGSGVNVLMGGTGNDTLEGGRGGWYATWDGEPVSSLNTGANTMMGGVGDDAYNILGSDDVVVENASEGDFDIAYSYIHSYTLTDNVEDLKLYADAAFNGDGNFGNNWIAGNANANILNGGGGNDELYGWEGEDTLDGGAGDDTIAGGSGNWKVSHGVLTWEWYNSANGNDTYLFNRGGGHDEIYDRDSMTGNQDKILLGNDIQTSDVVLRRETITMMDDVADHLVLTINGTSDSVTVKNWFDESNEWKVEQIVFADGTVWDESIIRQKVLQPTTGDDYLVGYSSNEVLTGLAGSDTIYAMAGDDNITGDADNDYLYGGEGNDTIDGGTGNDVLEGDAGDDRYIFDRGYGRDTISGDGVAAGIDIVQLGSNLLPGDINLSKSIYDYGDGNLITDLVFSIEGTSDTLTVSNWDNGSADRNIDQIQFANGTVWDMQAINRILALQGTDGDDAITGYDTDDKIKGYEGNDTLYGMAGNDTLDGGTGTDSMIGGTGDDTYIVDNTGDVLTENAGEGIDTVQSSVTYTLGNNVENLILTGTSAISGTGNTLDNLLTGNSGNNTLTGGAGNDTLNGGSGRDTMRGGTGNDLYIVDNTSDSITENASEGTDTVQSSVTFTLGSNVENLILTGTSAINGTGNTLNNTITGNSANNTLSGGSGADTMIGGAGNDTYVVDNTGDVVTENLNEGTELVQSSVTYTLGANIENITLTGSSAINATGNALDNYLTGNSGNNSLTGAAGNDTLNGGSGNDTMIGGIGNDTYVVGSTGDVVTENTNEGTDTVQSSITYTLGNNVENLTLTGSSAINGTGNALDNYLTGNSGNNSLTGNAGNDTLNGGAGNDTMIGGAGDDIYYVDSTSDVVTESAGAGTDTVMSSITYTLGNNVENLTLTGTSAINGTGNTLDNIITGNSGNNTLNGGSGNDTYVFSNGGGTDVVTDSGADSSTQDIIRFQSDVLKESIAIFQGTSDLTIGYADTDKITVTSQTSTNYGIEKVQLDSGLYMTATDINQLIQNMATFATAHNLAFSNVNDVKASPDLMAMVSNAWHA